MDPSECDRLLGQYLCGNSENPVINEENNAFTQYMEENPVSFFENLVELFRQSRSEEQFKKYITVIYSASLRNTSVKKSENIASILNSLESIYIDVVLNTQIAEANLKNLFALSYGHVIGFFYMNFPDDTNPQTNMLELINENNECTSFVMETMVEAMILTNSLSGFTEDPINQLVESTAAPLLSIFKMYITSATFSPSDRMKEILMTILPQIPTESLSDVFNIMWPLVAVRSTLFSDQLEQLASFICGSFNEASDKAINSGLFLLESFIFYYPEPVSVLHGFFEPVLQALITIMSTITEEAPLTTPTDSTEPYATATAMFSRIDKLLISSEASEYYLSLVRCSLGEVADWNVYHALITTISKLPSSIFQSKIYEEPLTEIFEGLVQLLISDECNGHIKFAIYQAMINFLDVNSVGEAIFSSTFEYVVGVYPTESEPELLRAELVFLKQLVQKFGDEVFEQNADFTSAILEAISSCEEFDFIPLFIDILGAALPMDPSRNSNINEICRIFDDFCDVESPSIKLSSIVAFKKYGDSIDEDSKTDDFTAELDRIFNEAVALKSSEELDPEQKLRLEKHFFGIIHLLGPKFNEYIGYLLPQTIELLQTEVNCQQYHIFDEIPLATLVKAPSVTHSTQENYIMKEDYYMYIDALILVVSCVSSMNEGLVSEYGTLLELAERYLNMDFFVFQWRQYIWMILYYMGCFMPQENAAEFFSKILKFYLHESSMTYPQYNKVCIDYTRLILKVLLKKEASLQTDEICTRLLTPIPQLIGKIANIYSYLMDISVKCSQIETGEDDVDVNNVSSSESSLILEVFTSISKLLKKCGELNSEILLEKYTSELNAIIKEMLNTSSLTYVSVKLITQRLLFSPNIEKVYQNLTNLINQNGGDIAIEVFNFIAKYFMRNDVDNPEFAQMYYSFASDYLLSDESEESVEPSAITLVTVLILRNRSAFDESIVGQWFTLATSFDKPQKYLDAGIRLITEFLNEGGEWIMDCDNINAICLSLACSLFFITESDFDAEVFQGLIDACIPAFGSDPMRYSLFCVCLRKQCPHASQSLLGIIEHLIESIGRAIDEEIEAGSV